jgi:hypothetical protein
MLTEVAGARRGWETAAARSSMTGVSAEAACRGQSASVLLEQPCVYGDGVVDLGKPWKQARAREIWVMRWCPVHAEKEQRGRRMIDGNLHPCHRSTRSSASSGDGFALARRWLRGREGEQE